jgi:hypothetical protein
MPVDCVEQMTSVSPVIEVIIASFVVTGEGFDILLSMAAERELQTLLNFIQAMFVIIR